MTRIPVTAHGLGRSYGSFEAALAGAMNHPLQPKAQSDGSKLLGSTFVDAFWTGSEFALGFSKGQWLHVFMANHHVRWILIGSKPNLLGDVQRIDSPPMLLEWTTGGEGLMDRSSLIGARIGKEFVRLWVNEGGFYVYTKKQLILCFHAIFRTDTGEDLLYVTEDD